MESMDKIYRKYAKTVYGFLLSKSGNADVAEELTQETFYQAVKGIDRFKGESKVSTWLCGIAKNVWFSYLKKKREQVGLEEVECIGAQPLEQDVFQNWEQVETLKMLHRLEEPMREVIYLRLIGNLSFKQIGEIMEHSENWARVTYFRGKEKIIREVKENE